MSLPLTRQRCVIHLDREAAARCPSCGRFYCRECVTEHEGRLLCERFAARSQPTRARGAWKKPLLAAGRVVSLTASVLLAWFFFHLLGRELVSLPDEFHAANLWKPLGGTPDADDE